VSSLPSRVTPPTKRGRRYRPSQQWGVGYFLYFLKHNPIGIVGLTIVVSIGIVAIIAPWIVPYGAEQTRIGETLMPPSGTHWFGTDGSGFDVFSRVLLATRTDIPVAVGAAGGAMVVGVLLGVIAGYFGNRGGIGGVGSEVLMRIMDVLQAIPIFVLAMALVTATGPSALNAGIATAFVATPVFLRLSRGQVLVMREMPFVEAARCAGAGPRRIAFRHILPGILSPAIISMSVNVGIAILLIAGLSFVGAGVRAPTPEWGLMIANGSRDVITGQWWTSMFPGLALAVTVLGFSLTGEALGRILDPLHRR
jgi:peptide/nickel transport system permease protein